MVLDWQGLVRGRDGHLFARRRRFYGKRAATRDQSRKEEEREEMKISAAATLFLCLVYQADNVEAADTVQGCWAFELPDGGPAWLQIEEVEGEIKAAKDAKMKVSKAESKIKEARKLFEYDGNYAAARLAASQARALLVSP